MLAAFQCVTTRELPPWWLLFEKVVLHQVVPTFAPNWEFELLTLNCLLSPNVCASLASATRFPPAGGQMLGYGGKHPAPHSG